MRKSILFEGNNGNQSELFVKNGFNFLLSPCVNIVVAYNKKGDNHEIQQKEVGFGQNRRLQKLIYIRMRESYMNAIKLYRIGNWCHKKNIPLIPIITKYIIFIIFNSVIPSSAQIGKKSKLAYGGIGCVVHEDAHIGSRVIIGQNVTIGRALDPSGVPVIGNNVYIATGAKIIGKVVIGDNVIIGANAVYTGPDFNRAYF